MNPQLFYIVAMIKMILLFITSFFAAGAIFEETRERRVYFLTFFIISFIVTALAIADGVIQG
ncbi:hypothetical protein ABFY54_28920 [Priestia megaterium]|uniref:hypothetical protein n=1 Tax=Priestia megaterium TaxID=1404 RepID=UPI003D27E79B